VCERSRWLRPNWPDADIQQAMTTREVVLDGGSPWGFRLHGGADLNQPLRISRVNPGSKAALRGIREGDFITSINNQSTKDISNAEAHALLRNSGDTLKLGLNEDTNGSPKRRQYKTVHQETHSETVKKSSVTSYTITSKSVSQGETSNEHKTSNGNTNGIDGEYCCRFYSSPNSLFRQGLLDLLLHACIYDRFID
jgi:hypothetical protein